MSFRSLVEAGANIRSDHLRARKRWQEGGDGGTVTDRCQGVEVVMKYEGSSRTSDFRSVHLDGHLFARETETVPWNVFEPITVGYTVFLDLSRRTAHDIVDMIKPVGKIHLHAEWYPAEKGPLRYYAHCDEFDDVIALWKVWRSIYLFR